MGVQNFIPTIWTAKLLVRLRKSLVFGNVVNTDYEGDISAAGDTVRISEVGPISVSNHTRDGAITWNTLDSASKFLLIDQQKDWNFMIDDLDAAQVKPKLMDGAMSEAAYALADTIDQHIAGLYAGAGVTGSSSYIGAAGSTVAVSSGNVLETLSYIGRYLSEANCPKEGRWGIVSPWFVQKLVLATSGAIASTGVPKIRDDGVLMNGWVGRIMGFDIMESNNVSVSSTEYRMMFGNRTAISHARQVAKTEAFRLQDYYADGVRGLALYGSKVVQPDALCTAYLAVAAG
jgi:N4-gp56 family major capsid protein